MPVTNQDHQDDDELGDSENRGQSDDVATLEKRIKGWQRKYNRLHEKASQWQQKLEQIETNGTQELADLEGEVITLRNKVKDKESLAQKISTLEAENAGLKRAASVRQLLSKPENGLADIIPFFDAGHFAPGDADDAAVLEKAKGFKALLGGRLNADLEQTLAGSKPQNLKPTDQTTVMVDGAGMTEDELRTWLYKNPLHQDYEKMEEAYYTLISPK